MNLSDILPALVAAIKAKKEVSAVEDEWISERVILLIEKRKEIQKKIGVTRSFEQFSRSKEYETLLKSIRADLHAVYGTFQEQLAARSKAFEGLKLAYQKKNLSAILELHKKILSTHTSTRERLQIYPILYKQLFAKTGMPKVLLDISCGLNPFSYPWIGSKLVYNASEVTQEDCRMVMEYFKIAGIQGEVIQLDILNHSERLRDLHGDVCFLWKVLDTLEYLERNCSRRILPLLNVQCLVVSFSTKTLSGKHMKKTRRLWFEKICNDNNWIFSIKEFENELFYVVKR